MALRSGLAGQIGFAKESTYGTRVVPTRFLEFSEEDLMLDIERMEAFGIRASAGGAAGTVLRTDRSVAGKKGGGGSISWDGETSAVANKGFGMLFENALGKTAVITTPMGGTTTRDHVYTLGDPFGFFLTCQVGRPDVGGTVRVHEFEGCKLTSLEFTQELDRYLAMAVELDTEDETTSQSLASASYPASQELFHWGQSAFTVGGGSLDIIGYSLKLESPQKTDRYFLRSSTLKKEPILNARRRITGELEIEYSGLTEYNRYLNQTIAAVVGTWTGSLIEASFNYRLILTCNDVRFDKPSGPNVKGPDLVTFTAPFEALYDGTDESLQIDYRTTDTAV